MIQLWKWMNRTKLYWIGAIPGAIAGFLYWKYVGCLTGNCAITSKPLSSMFYFALTGAMLFGLFKREQKNLGNEENPGG